MDAPEGTNLKLYRTMLSVTQELEKVNRIAWSLSGKPEDICGVIGLSIPDYTDETLIKEIELRCSQIEERRRYIAGLQNGEAGRTMATEHYATQLYQRYCTRTHVNNSLLSG